MIPGFGAHYRVYRLAAALDRLRAMPPGTSLTITRAAHLVGTSEKKLRELVQRFEPAADTTNSKIDAAALRRVVRNMYEARRQR